MVADPGLAILAPPTGLPEPEVAGLPAGEAQAALAEVLGVQGHATLALRSVTAIVVPDPRIAEGRADSIPTRDVGAQAALAFLVRAATFAEPAQGRLDPTVRGAAVRGTAVAGTPILGGRRVLAD